MGELYRAFSILFYSIKSLSATNNHNNIAPLNFNVALIVMLYYKNRIVIQY